MESMYWCWTHHSSNGTEWPSNYDRDYPDELEYKGRRTNIEVTYTVAQEEQAPDTKRYHLQGYVEFKKKIKLETLKKLFNNRIHWEIRKGTANEAANYCKKPESAVQDGLSWEKGVITNTSRGKRTDLDNIKDMVLAGKKRKEIATEFFGTYAKYHKGIEAAAMAMDVNIDDDGDDFLERECYIFYGQAGSGKSLACKRLMGLGNWYEPQQNAQGQLSFETYKGQKWIFLDDYEPTTLGCGTLKRMMDRGKCVLPGRGSSVPGRHVGVCITTNVDPEKWYKDKVHWNAISRRCKQVWICGDPESGNVDDPWMIIGGTEMALGHRVDSPLEELKQWIMEEKNKRDGAGQEESPEIDLR